MHGATAAAHSYCMGSGQALQQGMAKEGFYDNDRQTRRSGPQNLEGVCLHNDFKPEAVYYLAGFTIELCLDSHMWAVPVPLAVDSGRGGVLALAGAVFA